MPNEGEAFDPQDLLAEAEQMVGELEQTKDPEQKLLVLSRAWAVTQRIIAELQRRVEEGAVVSHDLERVQALAASFEEGSRNLTRVLHHELEEEAPG